MERYEKYELLIGGILEGFIFGTLSFGIISLGFGLYALWKHHKEKKVYWEYVGILLGPLLGVPMIVLLIFIAREGVPLPAPIIVFLGVLIGGVYLARKGNDLESKRKKRNTSQPNQ